MNNLSNDLLSELLQHNLVNVDDRIAHSLHLYIQGMEVTQGIQFYRSASHLTDPADQEVAEELKAFGASTKAGEHKLSLVANIGGQEGEVSLVFVTIGRPDEKE